MEKSRKKIPVVAVNKDTIIFNDKWFLEYETITCIDSGLKIVLRSEVGHSACKFLYTIISNHDERDINKGDLFHVVYSEEKEFEEKLTKKLMFSNSEGKYYTPTIEEFHVGFEYEARIPKMESFSKEVFYFNDSHKHLVNRVTIHEKDVRVKYLDKEDIESLGWEIDKARLDGETQLKFYKDNKCLYYRKENHEIGIFTIDPSKNDYYSRYNIDTTKVHIIIIKNKSELKRLLKQLGI